MDPLSRRESEMLALLAEGLSNRMIAQRLNISEPTVAMHIKNAKKRLGAKTREQAIAIAITIGAIRLFESAEQRWAG